MEVRLGYKRTEAGVIPEDWNVKPLASVLSKGRLGGNYPNQDREADYPLMKMGNIARGYIDTSKIEYIMPSVKPDPNHRLNYGDVLFNTRNTLDLVGKVAIWRDELPIAYYNSNLMRLEFDPQEVCSNEYANFALNSTSGIARLRALATGTTSVAAIYTRDLLRMPLVVPPPSEQRAIANALSDVDALIGALDQFIAKKRDLKRGAMQQLLTGKERLLGFGDQWDVKRIKELATLYQPHTISAAQFTEAGFPVYGANGVVGYYHSTNHERWQVTVTCRGSTCGTVNRTVDRCWITGNAMVLNCDQNPDLSKDFFYYLLLMQNLAECITGTGQPQIVRGPLSDFLVRLPKDKNEQIAIAEVLSDMDAEIAALEERREKTRALKHGMMQELLNGRTRLV